MADTGVHDRAADWDRISKAFEEVLSLPSADRLAYLDATYSGDAVLRSELESLLAASDGAEGFLDRLRTEVVQPALTLGGPHAQLEPDDAGDGQLAPISPGDRIRHFIVHERIGSGGAGVVHRGRDTLLERDVAIKCLAPRLGTDPAARARLVKEAQAASRLDDPHVCPIYAIETTDDGGLCIVMAYCAGGTLRDRLRRGPIAPADAMVIARHLARGLACAHAAGIVHGDIKPANVGFGDGDVARLLDFGVAVHAHDVMADAQRGLSGTLPYLAPELWHGAARDPRSDVWALGVTFFEIVTGRRPFTSSDASAIAESVGAASVPPLVAGDGQAPSPKFAQLIHRMLSAAPHDRPADGAAVLAALDAPVDAAAMAASANRDVSASTGRGARTTRLLYAAGAATLALLTWRATRASTAAEAPPRAVEVARSDAPLSTIAVLPFTTRGGREIEYLSDGMVDLLTPAFDGTGLVRGIDPNTVLGAAGDGRRVPLDSAAARAIATTVRADRYVVGSVVRSGTSLIFRATLRRIDGREVGRAQTTVVDSTALPAGVDVLVRQLIATELLAPGDTIAGVAAATTTSTRALRAYLDGERELRDARPAAAVANFQDAVAADSSFALAWYRLARAARWSEVEALSATAAQRAFALSASLPQRQQSLVRAYHTLRFGSARRAERQFAQIARDFPTDVEAWMLLGETQFGNNPYDGRPIDESAAAFQRVMALDPRNREVTVYLMDLAANANRLGQLDTLFRMYFSPNSAGEQPGIRATYIALHRRRTAPDAASPAPGDLRDDPALARVALQRVRSDPRDWIAARSFARALLATSATRTEGLRTLATLDVAGGDWASATSHVNTLAGIDANAAPLLRAQLALAPSVRLPTDTIRAIRSELQRAGAADDSAGTAELTAPERAHLRRYLLGLLSVRLADSAGVTAAIRAITAIGAPRDRLAAPLASSLTGHWALMRGNASAALMAFDQSALDIPARLRVRAPVLGQHLDRLAIAHAARQLGRHADAGRWYRSLQEGAGVDGTPFVAAADSGMRAVATRQSLPPR